MSQDSRTQSTQKRHLRPSRAHSEAAKSLVRSCVGALNKDRHRLRRAVIDADAKGDTAALEALELAIAESREAVETRKAAIPELSFDESLPVNAERETIAKAIADNQVVVLCGETGSGKTTQLPKICMSLGRGASGLIGHTQPRRIAARTVATRIASEVGCPLGDLVGYQVRFVENVSDRTAVKVMTDGVLLAELAHDRFLNAYDTLILDEAHERSLNIDFLLGYLKRLLEKRRDLKLIITSATIDPQRFSKHFSDAPIIEVSGRTYPVEVRYRPPEKDSDGDLNQAIGDAVSEAMRSGPGDVLVFLPGEREIREASKHLRALAMNTTDVLPLYARLNLAQQARIFESGPKRRVVLATNVAETSVTVPNIRYVVDTGVARVSRYSYRSKVQALPIEAISRASADQRKGRCGRVAAGVCLRLYSEEDFESRNEFTEPEIQRTNLAAVILQMKALRLGAVEAFPFIDPPDRRVVKDGYRLLRELGALDDKDRLTSVGRQLARLPLDPRIGRMLLAAGEFDCVREILTIASALSVNDPRERPMEAREAADAVHKKFRDKSSDFVSWLNLWDYFQHESSELSRSKFKALCQEHFLNHARLREWADVRRQLKSLAAEMKLTPKDSAATYEQVHRALLTGLVTQVGAKHEDGGYLGTRGARFHIFPGSGVKSGGPQWVMAGALTQTRRLFAHNVARIEPDWVEAAAGSLVNKRHVDVRFQARRGEVVATEQVNFLGLQLVGRRTVAFARIDPVLSREVFLREALVDGLLKRPPEFLNQNMGLIESLRKLEHKIRQGGLLAGAEAVYALYDARIGQEVNNDRSLRRWLSSLSDSKRQALQFEREELLSDTGWMSEEQRFPESLSVGEHKLPLSYHFEPGNDADGVTVTVPLAILNQLDARSFEWLVPGLLEERVLSLLRSLPKRLRRQLVPLPDFARACVESLGDPKESLLDTLSQELKRMVGMDVGADDWRLDTLAPHLHMRFALMDPEEGCIANSRSLNALKSQYGEQSKSTFTDMLRDGSGIDGERKWVFDDLPESVSYESAGVELTGYPALVDQGEAVGVRVFQDPDVATESHADGLARLFILRGGRSLKSTVRRMPQLAGLSLLYAHSPIADTAYCQLEAREDLGPATELGDDLLAWSARNVLLTGDANIRDGDAFEAAARVAEQRFGATVNDLEKALVAIISKYQEFLRACEHVDAPGRVEALADAKTQMARLVHRRFVAVTEQKRLKHLPRYIDAATKRLQKLDADARTDSRRLAEVLKAEQPVWRLIKSAGQHWRRRIELVELRWLLEEFRVSVFAQELGTAAPVSLKRIEKALHAAGSRERIVG